MTNRGDERVGCEERSRRAVEAAVSLARENRLRVEEPVVLNDLISLVVHLRPAPVVARVATCMPKAREPISAWLEREILGIRRTRPEPDPDRRRLFGHARGFA